MKKKLMVLSSFVLGFTAPLVALAQATGGGARCTPAVAPSGTIMYIVCKIGDILNLIIPVLIVLGVVYFVWGVITYVIASDEEAKKAGRDRMIFGIIGLAVIVAVWGLVRILTSTFGVDTGTQNINLPTTPY